MTNVVTGHRAELAVAAKLKQAGYKIIELNYKTTRCEIDLIARIDDVIYFVEVKYRVRSDQGNGFEYITAKKLNQVKFAARIWNQQNNWDGDYRLLGADVSGLDFEDISLTDLPT